MKSIKVITSVFLFLLIFTSSSWGEPKTGTQIAAIYLGDGLQPFTKEDGDQEMLDNIWIYYTDGTFEQFAEVDDTLVLFSTGTYEFPENSSFLYTVSDTVNGEIIIRRAQKYQAGTGLGEYDSEHIYDLKTLEYIQIFALEENGKKVSALYFGNDTQPFIEEDGETLDTEWIFYSDGSFDQYAELNDKIEQFSTGTYEPSDGSITINQTKEYVSGEGLTDSLDTFDLNIRGFDQVVAISNADDNS